MSNGQESDCMKIIKTEQIIKNFIKRKNTISFIHIGYSDIFTRSDYNRAR